MKPPLHTWAVRLVAGIAGLALIAPLVLYLSTRSWNGAAASDAWYLLAGLTILVIGPAIALIIWSNAAVLGTESFLLGFCLKLHEGLSAAVEEGAAYARMTLVIIPLALIFAGPLLILNALKPVIAQRGADRAVCCSDGEYWAQSPDLRWVVLADAAKDGVKITLVDLDHGRVTSWTQQKNGFRLQNEIPYPDPEALISDDAKEVVPTGSPRGDGSSVVVPVMLWPQASDSVDASVQVPEAIAGAFSKSWNGSPGPMASISNPKTGDTSSRQALWLSGNGEVMLLMPVLEEQSTLTDIFSLGLSSRLWRAERRRIVFKSTRTGAILKLVKLAYLPTAVASGDVDNPGIGVASNRTGSWWMISSGSVLRLIHISLDDSKAAEADDNTRANSGANTDSATSAASPSAGAIFEDPLSGIRTENSPVMRAALGYDDAAKSPEP